MILISTSIAKSGSTLLANYQEKLLHLAPVRSGQLRLKQVFGGRYIDLPTRSVLAKLTYINTRFGSVVVKCHWDVTKALALMQSLGISKTTITYRDPRDVILSAIDHGRRTRASGLCCDGGFVQYQTVLDSIPMVQHLISKFERWHQRTSVYCVKYENMMQNPQRELTAMTKFLNWDVSEKAIEKAVESEQKERNKRLNFNKGTTERWKHEMSAEEIEATSKAFYPFLKKMGYEA